MLSMEFVGPTPDPTAAIRGKRTKRPRPASPCGGSSSTSTSGGEVTEEEDMANCLILLAQGDVTDTTHRRQKCKVGFYVYECKTCNRTFPSFQALGGHRASHKRPKTAAEEKRSTPIPVAIPITDTVDYTRFQFNKMSSKIHECSICGSEFTSGQALGGHMRRHRAAAAATSTSTSAVDQHEEESERGSNILQFDLNLPAPEDDPREFQFSSATALVECHY